MSLRHLYKDLRDLGVYPDVIEGDRELSILFDYSWNEDNVVSVGDNKYYSMYTLDTVYNMVSNMYRGYIYKFKHYVGKVDYDCKASCILISIRYKTIVKYTDIQPWSLEDIEKINNMILDVLEEMDMR